MTKLCPVKLLLFFFVDSRITCFFGESCLTLFCFQVKSKMVSSEIWPVLNYLFELLLLAESFWKFGIDHDPIDPFGWTFARIPRSNQPVLKKKENEMSFVWNSDSTFPTAVGFIDEFLLPMIQVIFLFPRIHSRWVLKVARKMEQKKNDGRRGDQL